MTVLPLRRVLVALAVVVAVVTVVPATAVAATAPATITYDTEVSEQSIVTGDLLQVYVRTDPVSPDVDVRLYAPSEPAATWTLLTRSTTSVDGRVTFSFWPIATGKLYLKIVAVAPGATTPVEQPVPSVSVWPPDPVGADDTGPDLVAMRLSFCLAIGDAIKKFEPLGGPAYAAVLAFGSTAYQETSCYDRSLSQALWAGLADGLWAFGVDKFLDGAAEAAWGPVLDTLLSKARLTAIGLDQTAKYLFNSWILQEVKRVLDDSVECFRTHQFPAWECSYVPAESALLAQLIH